MSLKSAHFSAGKYQVFLWQRVDKLYKIQENLPASCRFYLILTCTGQLRRKTAVDFRTHILYNLICHIRYAGRRAGLLRACTIQLGGNFMNGQKICILVDSGCDVPQAVSNSPCTRKHRSYFHAHGSMEWYAYQSHRMADLSVLSKDRKSVV